MLLTISTCYSQPSPCAQHIEIPWSSKNIVSYSSFITASHWSCNQIVLAIHYYWSSVAHMLFLSDNTLYNMGTIDDFPKKRLFYELFVFKRVLSRPGPLNIWHNPPDTTHLYFNPRCPDPAHWTRLMVILITLLSFLDTMY